jgi:hypothetical protein
MIVSYSSNISGTNFLAGFLSEFTATAKLIAGPGVGADLVFKT